MFCYLFFFFFGTAVFKRNNFVVAIPKDSLDWFLLIWNLLQFVCGLLTLRLSVARLGAYAHGTFFCDTLSKCLQLLSNPGLRLLHLTYKCSFVSWLLRVWRKLTAFAWKRVALLSLHCASLSTQTTLGGRSGLWWLGAGGRGQHGNYLEWTQGCPAPVKWVSERPGRCTVIAARSHTRELSTFIPAPKRQSGGRADRVAGERAPPFPLTKGTSVAFNK